LIGVDLIEVLAYAKQGHGKFGVHVESNIEVKFPPH